MNQLISITTNENDEQLVSGRELHGFLEVKTPYPKWFERMTDYGFSEDVDYVVTDIFVRNSNGGRQTQIDHAMKLDMAKEVSMIQRNEKGKQARQYFLEVEKAWNNPDMIIKRALQIADRRVIELESRNNQLQLENSVQLQQIAELQPKASYYDWVLQTKGLIAINTIAKQYGKSAQWLNKLLHELNIQYKQGKVWLLYQKHAEQGYTKTNFAANDAERLHPHTYWTQKGMLFIYELLKSKGILPLVEREDFKAS